jgi:hypothetical protein
LARTLGRGRPPKAAKGSPSPPCSVMGR